MTRRRNRGAALLALLIATTAQAAPSVVRIVEHGGAYTLQVDGQPFVVRGAGVDGGDIEQLAARGGNAFRTWRPGDDGIALLDRAQRNGLRVALGLEVPKERHGFDFDDEAAVSREVERIRGDALRYRDHPALLLWLVGNELNLDAKNPRVWNAVNRMAEAIHAVDPNHPVITPLAGIDAATIAQLKARAPALDAIGVQVYGDIDGLAAKVRKAGWRGPYLVTEWGPTGHWESPATPWGAPIEQDSRAKADAIGARWQRELAPRDPQRLGSFVFLWGQKQERTPTWYGLFLSDGASTPAVDVLQHAWTGRWPRNRAPLVGGLRVDGRDARAGLAFAPSSPHDARIEAHDADGDRLAYRWRVLEESRASSVGGCGNDAARGGDRRGDRRRWRAAMDGTHGARRLPPVRRSARWPRPCRLCERAVPRASHRHGRRVTGALIDTVASPCRSAACTNVNRRSGSG